MSTPIRWDELETVVPDELTALTVPGRLAEAGDPWADMYEQPQSIDELVDAFRAGLEPMGDAPWPPV